MTDRNFREKTIPFAILLMVLLFLGFAFQGARGIFEPDECFYISIAQEMAQTGDYLIPRLHHETWLDKPPLSLWGVAAGIQLLGQTEFAARASHALAYVLTALLVFLLGRSLGGRRYAYLGCLIFATMVVPLAAANVVTPDAPLALWTTAAFTCFWESVKPGARRVPLWKILMCLAFGFGFLTKGPAALIPSGAMFLYLVLQKKVWRYFLTPWAIPCLAAFLVPGLSWYLFISQEVPGALAYIWDNQVVGRTVSDEYGRNPGLAGALIYVPLLLFGTLPWSIFWGVAAIRSGKGVFRRQTWSVMLQDPVRLFLFLWIAVSMTVLCLASSKLPLYALPVFPALALVTARVVPEFRDQAWLENPLGFSRRGLLLLGAWVLFMVAGKAIVAHVPSKKDMRALHEEIEAHLPEHPYEIVVVDDHLEGLGFYLPATVERVTTDDTPYPFFVLPEQVEEEIAELDQTDYSHAFVCRRDRRARQLRQHFQQYGIEYRETSLSFNRFLFTVPRLMETRDVVRLAAMGDFGKGRGGTRSHSMASALRRAYGEMSFEDGVLFLGDNLYSAPDETLAASEVAHREFEEPLQDLIEIGIPFFAALGNHDRQHGLDPFELEYPLFNMEGQRYYSRVFDDGLAEVFFLDSTTLEDEDVDPDPRQIEWLRQSLQRSTALWKIVCLHHPVYSTASKYSSDPDMIQTLEPLFLEGGVSLVLQGHNHVYERLAPIKGIHYITAGSGGTVRKKGLIPNDPKRIAGNDDTMVFITLEITPAGCAITAYDTSLNIVDNHIIPAPSGGAAVPVQLASRPEEAPQ